MISPETDRLGSTRPWVWPALIAILAVVASLSGITNQYVQDDIPLIWKNEAAHRLSGLGRGFVEPYWPPPFSGSLYRPLATLSFTLEWLAGSGAPVVFRLVSYALYAGTAVAFFSFARLRLPLLIAVATAALFAVHPVHVEAVAVAVNQSELWVGGIAAVMVVMYVRERERNAPLSTRFQLALSGLYLVACLFKENALVIPGLLLAAELLFVSSDEPVRARIPRLRPTFLLLMLIAVAFYAVRTRVLSGNLAGTFTAEHLVGLTMAQRAFAMLAVVPEWFRLLFWPAQLKADYGPQELMAQTAWSGDHTLGALLLLGTVVTAVAAWRRAPVITFGIAWCAVALFPVSNVLLPTGILLAERTLFLPSLGAMLALGGIAAVVFKPALPRVRLALAFLFGVLLLAGLSRSITRHPVWRTQFGLWYQTANEDAPRSFRAHEAMAESYFQVGMERMAALEYELAIQFAPPTMLRPRVSFADKLRRRGACYPAVEHYRITVTVEPRHVPARAALVACLLDIGRYREASLHARLGKSLGWQVSAFQRALDTADSALRVSAPPGTVRVGLPSTDSLSAAFAIGKPQ